MRFFNFFSDINENDSNDFVSLERKFGLNWPHNDKDAVVCILFGGAGAPRNWDTWDNVCNPHNQIANSQGPVHSEKS